AASVARGSSVTITVQGDIAGSGTRWHVRETVTTFVRDVVTSADLYPSRANAGGRGAAGGVPPWRESAALLGDDAGMR
ncbi:MAG TPA: hypothetical protein VHV30_17895, partial [Polyangiaceae bacterium]|nr:hypothetical protein [Polyangiaceae bacterium]